MAASQAEEVLGDQLEIAPPQPAPAYLRTALEELGFLGVQTAWYWGHSFHGDEKFNWDNWSKRLTSYHDVVLDDDKFRTGAAGHPIAGAGYYLIARGNGFGALGSFAITLLASTTWQYFSEWNEKPATNDLLVTPVAGWAIGEASYRLGQYFLDGGPGLLDCVGAALFSPVATYNDARRCRSERHPGDGEEEQSGGAGDHAGRRGDLGHRFDLAAGTARSAFDRGASMSALLLDAEVRLTTHRHYQRPGAGRSTARPGQWTTLTTDWMVGQQATRGFFFHADSVAVGDYRRRYDDLSDGRRPDGRGNLLAVGSSYDYASRALPGQHDRVMSIGIAGPMLELTATGGQLDVRAKAAVYYGFAQVTSLAYAGAAPSLSGQTIRTVLRRQGYYYAQALLPSAEVEARSGRFRLTVAGRGGAYWSIEGDDSHESQLTNRFALRDTRLRSSATFAVQPDRGPFRFALELVSALWGSTLPGHTVSAHERTIAASVVVGL